MRFILLLLVIGMAYAVPTLDDVRKGLGSGQAAEREKTTLELWTNGPASLAILQKLTEDPDPEISQRAAFVLRRLKMGLKPDSPEDLLTLAELLEQASPEKRATHLAELLDHEQGALTALFLLDQWAEQELITPARLVSMARIITEALLEQRSQWQAFFTTNLSPACRAAIVIEFARQELPMQDAMIAILAKKETEALYRQLQKLTATITPPTRKSLARIATLQGQIPLALTILNDGLTEATEPDLARTIAFLEHTSGTPAIQHNGPWLTHLKIFRARLQKNYDQVLLLNQRVNTSPIFRYENNLITGSSALPSMIEGGQFLDSEIALKALHTSFGKPPRHPDIEALSAEILIDWTTLARTLAFLGSPLEASEILSTNGQNSSAVGLLWRAGRRGKALELATPLIEGIDESDKVVMSITLAKLFLESGELEEAKKIFEPLLYLVIDRDDHRSVAISLGRKLLPREKLITLAPNLRSDQSYLRANAISAFLDFPKKVSVFWFEHFLAEDPLQSPEVIFKKVENLLTGDQTEARKIISEKLKKQTKKNLLPVDSLYQNAFFLRLPSALPMVTKAAWYQLSSKDLEAIARDDSLPIETRKEALASALLINPTSPSLNWHHHHLCEEELPDHLLQSTLGNPGATLQLGSLTGKRETLEATASVASFKDAQTIRVLATLAKSRLKNNQPTEAARLFQAALCGEIAFGNQPATPIKATFENLTYFFKARASSAPNDSEKELWQQRLSQISPPPSAQEDSSPDSR